MCNRLRHLSVAYAFSIFTSNGLALPKSGARAHFAIKLMVSFYNWQTSSSYVTTSYKCLQSGESGTVFTTLLFLCDLWLGPIGSSDTLRKAGKVCL